MKHPTKPWVVLVPSAGEKLHDFTTEAEAIAYVIGRRLKLSPAGNGRWPTMHILRLKRTWRGADSV